MRPVLILILRDEILCVVPTTAILLIPLDILFKTNIYIYRFSFSPVKSNAIQGKGKFNPETKQLVSFFLLTQTHLMASRLKVHNYKKCH